MIKFNISLATCILLLFANCSSDKKCLTYRTPTDTLSIAEPKVKASEIKNPYYDVNSQLDLFQKNISFYAGNSVGGWQLFIKKDSSFTFELNGTKTVFEFSKATQAQDASIIRYYSKKVIQTADTTQQKKSISIVLSTFRDFEWTSRSYLPFHVDVTIEDQSVSTTYSGEGFFISNPALHDIWVLDSLNNEKVDITKFSHGLPRLEFHLDGGKLYGFSGCNELRGSYYIIQDEIHFNPLAHSMKFCVDTPGENSFLDFLNKNRFEYRINNLRLTLLHKDKSNMVFKKVD